MDRAPRPGDEQENIDLTDRLARYLLTLDWVAAHDERLREEGDVCVGEIFLVPRVVDNLPQRLAEAACAARGLDRRIYDLVATAVPSCDRPAEPGQQGSTQPPR